MPSQIQLVVFDWAGTTTDFGSQAPVQVFAQTFAQYGLTFGTDEINAPMGMEKKAHIRTMLSTEHGRELWMNAKGTAWTENDIESLYESFEENLRRVVAQYSHTIPGVTETVKKLRGMGLKIGSTTGYTSEMMQFVLPTAKADGYEPDCVVTPDVTGYGRPTPFMLYECMRQMNVWPASRVVKVGDTAVDMREGKNAGAWAVGILKGSNLMGLSEEEYKNASPEELRQRGEHARKVYAEAGADMVIESIEDLPAAVEEINLRMAEREA